MSSSHNSSHTEATNPQNDLIDDRAIENASSDHFGLAGFAAQAASTIHAIRTPANIAIYAPWGSGKTSLANLLRNELNSKISGFVYFDAFKYAEAPLRREFITRVYRLQMTNMIAASTRKRTGATSSSKANRF